MPNKLDKAPHSRATIARPSTPMFPNFFLIKMDDVETQIILLLDFGVNMLLMVQTYLVFEFASISITLAPFNSVHCCSCKHLQIAR